MIYKSFLLLLLSFVLFVEAQQGDCDVTDPDYVGDWEHGDFWFTVEDVDKNFKFKMTTAHISGVTLVHKYIEADVANDVLTFSAKPEFERFIQNEKVTRIERVELKFSCENGGTPSNPKYITLVVSETQIFPPEFIKKDYSFHLAMPIAPNQIIDATAMEIRDFNIDEAISVAFVGGDSECTSLFDFNTDKQSDANKIYTTKLKTKSYVALDKNITCLAQVTDKSGKTDDAKIVIDVDVENSKVPNPIFKEPIYIVNYASGLKISLELLQTVFTPKVTLKDDNNYAKYFKYNVVGNNVIEIVLNEDIPEDDFEDKNYFVLLVEVEYDKADNIGKTAILVDLNRNTATTTTSTTTMASTTPCDCTTVTDPETTTTTESDTTCPPCPDCTTTSDPGNTSTCPSSPTTCPECPDTSTLPGEGTTSSTCPETTTCPMTCPECPETTTSDGEGTTCPETTTCPTTCPSCPETTTWSGEGTSCPECPITCPSCPETTTSSGESSVCPECPTTCPSCPQTTTSDGEGTTCPETTTCPTTCPSCPETTTWSGEGTSCPECPITCPPYPETTTLPGDSSVCPECPTTCPSCPQTTTSEGEGSPTPPTSSTTCAPWEPAPQVQFETKTSLVFWDKGSTGFVQKFKAVSDITNEEITYAIRAVNPTAVKDVFKITHLGEVNIIDELDEGMYEITITAFGKQSKSEDVATLFLIIEYTVINCPDNTIQVKRLFNTKVKEGEAKKLISANENWFEFTTDNDDILDWFKINDKDGSLEVLEIDREDERIKSLLAPQIQVKIRAIPKNTPPALRYNFSVNPLLKYAENDAYHCLDIKNIDTKSDTMLVVVNVEDVNDNPPKFIETSPLTVGYPEPKLIELIAPPYLVKVTATDEDFGDYAKIKYTTNSENFVADSENGIIFLTSEISDDTEFKVVAEDNNGNGGNKAELSVNVKLLKEEHISVITIENIAYSEIEGKVKEISLLTKQTVKYLSSIALPKVTKPEKSRMYSVEEKIPAVRIILYALNNKNEVISSKDFKEITDGTDLGIEIKVEEYSAVRSENPEDDNTGWIAAVSTLSVLLALVIIGGLLGYIFYLRPRMVESFSDGYKKHINRDSIQSSTIETKMESSNTLADRRPTGFPIGFKVEDLEDEDDEDYEENLKDDDVSTDLQVEHEDNKSIKSHKSIIAAENENEEKPKTKSGVKFDTNVTEIEIEIEEF